MFARVRLLNGCHKTFTYTVPEDWNSETLCGSLVTVPFHNRLEKALVIELTNERSGEEKFEVRALAQREPFPNDPIYRHFIQALAHHYAIDPFVFYQRLRTCLKASKECPEPYLQSSVPLYKKVQLTPEQEKIVAEIIPDIDQEIFRATLLHGVTGSGKTEIYKKLFIHTLAQGKSALLLTPEVSLAVQFTALLRKTLPPTIPIFCFHSATSATEKKQLWRMLIAGRPVLIIGVHQPIFLPIPELGLIVVDEEHESGYQEKKHPKINTREAAIMRAQRAQIPIVLGSATPALTSWWCTQTRGWRLCSLTQRFGGSFPTVKMVNIRNDEAKRSSFWLSTPLEEAIRKTLAKQEQIIIYLNRRGYSFFVQCAECGFVFTCRNCSVSLTLHDDKTLRCHYCGHQEPEPSSCPNTKCSPTAKLLKKGIGTQQVVSILARKFPHARIARADLDATINKKKWSETIGQFTRREIDILVGTQTITKGYHFPGVTLVGVLWADVNLTIPFYNAAETTLQQLLQVAGRAGRQSPESLVIVQTLVDHQLFRFLNEVTYPEFLTYELEYRQSLSYPPYVRFVELELKHEDETVVQADALACVVLLKEKFGELTILGPAQPPVHKVKNVFSRKIYLKAGSYKPLLEAYCELKNIERQSSLYFTPNPQQ